MFVQFILIGVIRAMQIIILTDELQKAELFSSQSFFDVEWISDAEEFLQHRTADAFIDLAFLNEKGRKALLAKLLPKPVIINSVANTLRETDDSFIRINGWNTFLSSGLIEAACNNESLKKEAEGIFERLNKKVEWLPDEPGFVTPRVVSMMINEAYISLGEGVSTKEEINTAMKLGTSYPYGPFEWAEKIGVQNIVTLLEKLTEANVRYKPTEFLVQETNRGI